MELFGSICLHVDFSVCIERPSFLGGIGGDCERFDSQKIWSHMHFAVQATRQKLERTHVPPAKTHLDTRQRHALWILVENRGKMPEGWRNITLPKLTSPTWGQGKSSAICSFSKVSIHSPTWKFQQKEWEFNTLHNCPPSFWSCFFSPNWWIPCFWWRIRIKK